jgi:hypothetical protein
MGSQPFDEMNVTELLADVKDKVKINLRKKKKCSLF